MGAEGLQGPADARGPPSHRRWLLADLFGQLETKTMEEELLQLEDKSAPGSLTAKVTELLLSCSAKWVSKRWIVSFSLHDGLNSS